MKNNIIYSGQINCHETLENCKFVKTILMLSVIMYHCVLHWYNNGWIGYPVIESKTLGILTEWFASFHIYAFTLVSGYIFAYKIWKSGGCSSYKKFVLKKTQRLLIPYIFTLIVWVVPIELLMSSNKPTEDLSFFRSYYLGEGPSQLWFLLMLFGVFVIAYPIRNVLLRPFKGFIISIIFYCAGVIGYKLFPNIFQIWISFQYIIYFYIGMQIWIRQAENKSLLMNKIPWWICGVIHGFGFIFYFFIEDLGDGIIEKIIKVGFLRTYHIIGAISAFVILQKAAELLSWKNKKSFKVLSAFSMPMYLFHQQIVYFVILWLDGKVSPGLNAAANFIISFSASFIISWIFMRFKTTRFLIGEK